MEKKSRYHYVNAEKKFLGNLNTRTSHEQINKYYLFWIEQILKTINASNFIPQIREEFFKTIFQEAYKIKDRKDLETIIFTQIKTLSSQHLVSDSDLKKNSAVNLYKEFILFLDALKDIFNHFKKLHSDHKAPLSLVFQQQDIRQIANTIHKKEKTVRKILKEAVESIKITLTKQNKAKAIELLELIALYI